MKPLLKIINRHENEAFQIMKVLEPYFFPSWHFHPEYEIMLVQEGTGIRYVGDSMERFRPGDLVFYGSNIPHFYRSDNAYYEKSSGLVSQAMVVYFKEHFLGDRFWEMPDTAPVKRLLALAGRGIRFRGKAREALITQMHTLESEQEGIGRIIALLSILKTMTGTREYELLSSNAFVKHTNKNDCERINKVYQFIMDNYAANPSLEQVSKMAYMSTTAFCRYFKSHTYKTFTQFLNEIKIGNACKLLIDNKLTVTQVCFESGFNNFTHFNNQFKKITGLTPSKYQYKHFQ